MSNRADLRECTKTTRRHGDRRGQIADFWDSFETINWLYLLFKCGIKTKTHFEWLLWHWSSLGQLNLEPTRPLQSANWPRKDQCQRSHAHGFLLYYPCEVGHIWVLFTEVQYWRFHEILSSIIFLGAHIKTVAWLLSSITIWFLFQVCFLGHIDNWNMTKTNCSKDFWNGCGWQECDNVYGWRLAVATILFHYTITCVSSTVELRTIEPNRCHLIIHLVFNFKFSTHVAHGHPN